MLKFSVPALRNLIHGTRLGDGYRGQAEATFYRIKANIIGLDFEFTNLRDIMLSLARNPSMFSRNLGINYHDRYYNRKNITTFTNLEYSEVFASC